MTTSINNFEVVCANVRVVMRNCGESWQSTCEAAVKVKISGREEYSIGEGNGPLNALDNALRKALCVFPCLRDVTLSDYAVNVFDGMSGSAVSVKVFIWFSSGEKKWTVEKISTDIINASFHALVDGYKIALSNCK